MNTTKDKKKHTYFSFPASLEANLVYQRATLKAMETSSKTASCWALGGKHGEMVGYKDRNKDTSQC